MNEPTGIDAAAPSPFHAGEQAVQQRAGVREKIESIGQRFIREAMPEQHRDFFAQLPTLFVGSLDSGRRPWASVLAGEPGFVSSPDERTLHVAARAAVGDPLAAALATGVPLGLLGLQPHTRRRNRMNGTVIASDQRGFTMHVEQSFGNCPQYIQARTPQWVHAPGRIDAPAVELGAALNDDAHRLIGTADTLFIASAAADARGHGGAAGVDVSHRGGRPGFVRIDRSSPGPRGRSVLSIPDFRGNFMFNTLGNIAAYPRAGLLFIDYARGDLLQLTGTAEIVWSGAELESFAGAQRLLRFEVEQGLWRARALPLRWTAPEAATQLAQTGTWGRPAVGA